jgi:hypothetical protein
VVDLGPASGNPTAGEFIIVSNLTVLLILNQISFIVVVVVVHTAASDASAMATAVVGAADGITFS